MNISQCLIVEFCKLHLHKLRANNNNDDDDGDADGDDDGEDNNNDTILAFKRDSSSLSTGGVAMHRFRLAAELASCLALRTQLKLGFWLD